MAVKNRTNLIKEFLKEKNNHLILLTTYSFDPVFFDYFLYPELARNNPFAEVVIFVDGYTYQQTYPKFTPKTGTEYRLVPVYQKGGVFHPKIGIFYSREKDRAKVFIGSANLTLAGFTRNAEVVLQIEYTPAKGSSFLHDLLELFLKLFESGRCVDSEVRRVLENRYEELSEGGSSERSEVWIFHNLTKPILDQICDAVEGKKFSRMVVVAPYFSSDAKNLLAQLRDCLGVEEIIIGVQKKNHNLEPETVSRYLESARELGLRLEFREAVFSEKNRRIHAKLIQLDGIDGSFLIVGSPNFTEPALLSVSENGNLETAVLLSKDLENIVDEIQFKELQFSDDFWGKSAEHEEKGKRLLKVYSAEYDEIDRKLLIHLEPITCKFSCKVHYENDEEEEWEYNAPEALITITLGKPSNPKEVVIKAEDGRSAVIRIYNADSFKRLVRRGRRLTIREVLRVIESRPSIDLDEILLLVNRLVPLEAMGSDISVREVGRSVTTSRKRTFEPSKKSVGGTSIESIVMKLEKTVKRFLKTRAAQREMEMRIEDMDEGDVDTQNEGKSIDSGKKDQRDYRKDILRHLKTLWNQLYSKEDSNRNLEIATVVAEVVLRILLCEYNQDFFMEFKRILDEYLEDLETSSIDRGALKDFFLSLLKLHYVSNCTIYEINDTYDFLDQPYKFIRDLFDYRTFTHPEIFNEIRSRFVEFIIQGVKENIGKEFNAEKFMVFYGNLVASSLSPSSVSEGVRTLVKNLVYSSNEDVKKVSYYTLLNFKEIQLSYSSSVRDEIREILATEKLEERTSKLLEGVANK
ncbi:MAG: hypothetical protein J7K36_08615 [Archaeoglobaceae archaeon]|nr:hypothetical protein [Archaeoglobaceae archaeon]